MNNKLDFNNNMDSYNIWVICLDYAISAAGYMVDNCIYSQIICLCLDLTLHGFISICL